ncbi:putative porin [Salinisphaera sp.]|uniref:putative porin n=1 Tax=Salinisphaera sp. TaxID=1914330 RepID=UPI002D798B8D|nr:putative porin [Salinisphaera sp.]HET7314527.1 putative porin [Salinisphaera sp.]
MKLIQMMHANGSITDTQFNQLKAAAAEEGRNRMSSMADTNAGTDTSIPTTLDNDANTADFRQSVEDRFDELSWLDKIKFTGDLRLRYEYNDNSTRQNAAGHNIARNRGRLRYRLGIIAAPIANLEVGAGIASGGDDPRSTNQTFGDDFSSKPIRLDYAYAAYKFNDYIEGIGGKFKFGDYLWMPTDLIWDGDINPEGASVHLHSDTAVGTTFLNSGVWVLQEFSGNSSDPYLYYVQGGQHFESDNLFASLAGTYYGYENTAQPGTFNPDYSAGTNTTTQFSVIDVNGQIGTRFGAGGKASLIGEYVKNIHSGVGADTGYALGAKVGWNKWAMKYLYGDLDANAVPDTFPDSDRLGGATAMKGHEVALSYALNDAVELGLDYYNSQSKRTTEDEQLLQADVVFSF